MLHTAVYGSAVPAARSGERHSQYQQVLSDILLGATTGAVAKTAMAPLERVKMLMQTQYSNSKVISSDVKPYRSMGDCFRRVYAEQGLRAFWRGNVVNILRYAPQAGSTLAFNDAINNAFPQYDPQTHFAQSLGVRLMSGGIAGTLANTITYPFDYVRTRLASDLTLGKPQYNGIWDCVSSTVRKQGVRSLFNGYGATVAGSFVCRGGQLGLFRQVQDFNPYHDDKGVRGAVSSFAAVCMARAVILPLAYPFDTLRRRMMLESEKPPAERLYRSSLDCFRKVVRSEGIKGVYKGMAPELLRGVGGSLVIVFYDRVKLVYQR